MMFIMLSLLDMLEYIFVHQYEILFCSDESKQSDAVEMKQSDKAAISPAHDTDDPNDEIYDDDEAADDFEEGIKIVFKILKESYSHCKSHLNMERSMYINKILKELFKC